ncbi:MAG: hypothetical protein Tsb0034_19980 [Ekhidna sp.]
MGEIKRSLYELIHELLVAKKKYAEWIGKNDDSEMRSLAEEARVQKKLQALELCRLFDIDQVEAVPSDKLRNEELKEVAHLRIDVIIKRNEEQIVDMYQALLEQEKVNVFESFVLENHIKNEEKLLKRVKLH